MKNVLTFIDLVFLILISSPDFRSFEVATTGSFSSWSRIVFRPAAGRWRSEVWAATPLDRANFTGLFLGCIEAKFCKQILM